MKPIKCFTYVLCLVAVVVTTSLAQTQSSNSQIRQRRLELQRTLSAFAAWTKRYNSKTGAVPRNAAVEEGLRLAKQRRAALRNLIESDPALALSASIERDVRSALPSQIKDELETQVSGTGDFLVVCAIPAQGSPEGGGILRLVQINGRTYRGAVYGRRAAQSTKLNVPLHGIAVDDVLALDQDVLAQVTSEEATNSIEPIVDLSTAAGPSLQGAPVFGRMGERTYRFASAEHLRQSEALLEEAESSPESKAPETAASLLERAQFHAGSLRATARPQIAPPQVARDYSVLVIRADFPDLPGDPAPLGGGPPLTASSVQDIADGQVAPFYHQSSYGNATLHFTVSSGVYRLPGAATQYASSLNPFNIYTDAIAVAGVDYAISNYDKVIVLISYLGWRPNSQFRVGGLSIMNTPQVLVNGEFDLRVVAHELGHTFNLYHANFWQSGNPNPVQVAGGSTQEYCDYFDAMGYNWGDGRRADFNPWYKYQLNWLQDTQIQTVTQSGVYRLYRFDNADATGTLALKVAKDDVRDYWIGYRRNFAENAGLQHGAYVIWGYHSPQQSNLMGLGPQLNNAKDPGLPVGGIMADPQANFSIDVVAEGGAAPHEYLDVQIIFGVPPMVYRQPESQTVLQGELAQFSVGTSADSDYLWQRLESGTHEWVNLSEGGGYSGTATATLQVSPATLSMSGNVFRCLLTNAQGGFNASRSAALTVKDFGVQTLAGRTGQPGLSDGIAGLAQFRSPMGIAVDRSGTVYVADTGNHIIRKVSPTGLVSTLAGMAGAYGHVDGAGSDARFNSPVGIAVDSEGNLYVADQFDSSIRKITPDGVVTTLSAAFSAVAASDANVAPAAAFNHPNGIAVDCFGNLYIADTGSSTIRKLTPDGVVSILAGVSGEVGADDGPGAVARFNSPFGIAVDLDGNVYVTDQGNSTVRKIKPDGTVGTVAGLAGDPGSLDGTGLAARLSFPSGVAVDTAGNLYVADRNNSTIRKMDSSGQVSTLAGVAGTNGSADGAVDTAQFNLPVGVAVDVSGIVYVADTSANTVRMIRSSVPEPPVLRMNIVDGQLMLCWPSTSTAFVLESRSNFAADAPWIPVASTPQVQGCNFVVTASLQAPAAFFRLHHQ